MKKFLALVMAAAMMLSCVAFAEVDKIIEIDRSLEARLEKAWVDPTTLTADWTLVSAYVSEDFLDEFGIEGVEAGEIAVTPGAIKMTLNAELDHCANDPTGPLVDVANYWHAHNYCMKCTLVFAGHEDEEYTLTSEWDQWDFVNRGNGDGDYNFGAAKTAIKGDDELLHWTEITGIDYEDQEEMKWIFINTSGQMVLCCADKPLTKEKNNKTVWFAYIFDRVPAEVVAE